jgi:hypothetical protein
MTANARDPADQRSAWKRLYSSHADRCQNHASGLDRTKESHAASPTVDDGATVYLSSAPV